NSQWQIETAERRRVQERKCEEKCSSACKQPDFVSIPYRSDRMHRLASLRFRAGDEEVNDSYTQVEAVQHDVNRKHYRYDPEPQRTHRPHLTPSSVCVHHGLHRPQVPSVPSGSLYTPSRSTKSKAPSTSQEIPAV